MLPVDDMPQIIIRDSFAVSVENVNETEFRVNPPSFSGARFNISTNSSIKLPKDLLNFINNSGASLRIAHSVYRTDSLFLRRDTNNMEVGSLIISISIVNQTVEELDPPIDLQLQRNPV